MICKLSRASRRLTTSRQTTIIPPRTDELVASGHPASFWNVGPGCGAQHQVNFIFAPKRTGASPTPALRPLNKNRPRNRCTFIAHRMLRARRSSTATD